MSIKTTEPHMQPLVDEANMIMDRVYSYIHKRMRNEPRPDLSNAHIVLGHAQRQALGYCSHCIPINREGPDNDRLCGIRIIWCQERTRMSVVEDALNTTDYRTDLSINRYKLEA